MEVAAAIAPAMTEPFSSQMTGPVETVLAPEHLASKMQYQTDPTQLGQQITQIILSSPEPEMVLPKIAGALGKVFQVDVCLIVPSVSVRATPQLAYWNAAECQVEGNSQSSLLWENSEWAAALTGTEPSVIRDIQASQFWQQVGWHGETLPVQAVLGIRTWFQSSANGVIVLGRIHTVDWIDREKELLKAVSDKVAIAISQVQLQRQARTAVQYQTLINQVALALQSARETEQILQVVTQETAQALQVDRGLILLLKYSDPLWGKRRLEKSTHSTSTTLNLPKNRSPEAQVTVVCEWFGKALESDRLEEKSDRSSASSTQNYPSFWLSECSLCQKAFKKAPEVIAIADRREVPPMESENGVAQLLERDAMPAILMVPLESQGTVLGFLVLQHHQPRVWRLEELDLVKWVGTQASTAIIQSQTLRQVQAVVEERTGQLQRSLEVQAKLYEKTRQQVDQLRQLNQLKDEFLSSMSHELRTPLTTMSVAIELLRQPELSSELRGKYLDILKQQCTHEINLINDLLALQKLESHKQPIQLQKIDLKPPIANLATAFEQQWADKGLTLLVDFPEEYATVEGAALSLSKFPSQGKGEAPARSLMLQTDPDSLNRILLELLTNAGKYSDPDTTVRLRVTQRANQIVFALSNTGPGISPTELTYIFEKFRRGQGATQQAVQGTGLGLALVKSLVQHLNGTIDVSSCPTENSQRYETCFTLTLPQFFDSTKV